MVFAGKKLSLSDGYMECRAISGGATKWFKLSLSPSAVSVPPGGAALDQCRLVEARINKFQPWNVGFPRGLSRARLLASAGVGNVQLVAVDFSNAVGAASELADADAQIAEFNK